MSQVAKRTFGGDFKRAGVKRMEAGESSAALSRGLAVRRTLLHRWRDIVRRHGKKAFAGNPGRPSKVAMLTREHGAEGGDGTGAGAAQDRRTGVQGPERRLGSVCEFSSSLA